MDNQNTFPALKSLYFYMTEGCNLACKHCWLAPKFDKNGSKYPIIDIDLFKQIIKEALPLGLQNVKLTGGEPLMHPSIYEILEFLQLAEISLRIESNGLLCDEKLAAKIAEFSNPFISVSLDGATTEVHDKIRGVSGAFKRTVNGIKNLVNNGVNTQIVFSIMRDNLHQYEEIIKVAEQLGVGSIKYNIVQPTERGLSQYKDDCGVSIEEYVAIGKQIEEGLASTTPVILLYDHPIAFRPLHILAEDSTRRGACGIKQILGVLADGTYALCGIGTIMDEMHFGQAGKDALENVWRDNAILNRVRTELPEKFTGVCARCLMKEQCLGSCVAQTFYRTHDILASFWYCAEAEEKDLFPKSRLADN